MFRSSSLVSTGRRMPQALKSVHESFLSSTQQASVRLFFNFSFNGNNNNNNNNQQDDKKDPTKQTTEKVVEVKEVNNSEPILEQTNKPKPTLILPIQRRPVFPGLYTNLTFHEPHVLSELRDLMKGDGPSHVALFLRRDLPTVTSTSGKGYLETIKSVSDIYSIGTYGTISRTKGGQSNHHDGTNGQQFVFIGERRATLKSLEERDPFPLGHIELWPDAVKLDQYPPLITAYMQDILNNVRELVKLNPLLNDLPYIVQLLRNSIENQDPYRLIDVSTNVILSPASRSISALGSKTYPGPDAVDIKMSPFQKLLELEDLEERLKLLLDLIIVERQYYQVQSEIQSKVDSTYQKHMRQALLKEHMKVVKQELNEVKDEKEELIQEFQGKLLELQALETQKLISPDIIKRISSELNRLNFMEKSSSEFNVTKSYLEALFSLPWGKYITDPIDLIHAKQVLDEDHFGLEEIKQRILEFIAVGQLSIAQQEELFRLKTLIEQEKLAQEKLQTTPAAAVTESETNVNDIIQHILHLEKTNNLSTVSTASETTSTTTTTTATTSSNSTTNPTSPATSEPLPEVTPTATPVTPGSTPPATPILPSKPIPLTAGKILCFVGPPGVGKTSVAKSIARALKRPYYSIPVGGLDDPAEIKGHRRTYIAALPGKPIQSLQRAKVFNPVIIIDEIDKLTRSYSGDPASALLELLDKQQNNQFLDHYLDVPIDFSHALFLCTANDESTIPGPLKDRMEIIRLTGYDVHEKVDIAKKYLIPKSLRDTGLVKDLGSSSNAPNTPTSTPQIQLSKEAIELLIRNYCRESGVRSLEKYIDRVMRKVAYEFITKQEKQQTIEAQATTSSTPSSDENTISSTSSLILQQLQTFQLEITPSNLEQFAGKPNYYEENIYEQKHAITGETLPLQPGLVMGLAWNPLGGSPIFIETVATPTTKSERDQGVHMITGQLGSVMKESVQIAYTFIRTFVPTLLTNDQYSAHWKEKVNSEYFHSHQLHLHVPEGAVSKDGPSAGVAISSSFLSLALNTSIRANTAMTGEISLIGKVLPVGGIKEKTLAAKRAGAKTLILPFGNRKDFEELPDYVKKDVDVHFVKHYSEVFHLLFDIPYQMTLNNNNNNQQ